MGTTGKYGCGKGKREDEREREREEKKQRRKGGRKKEGGQRVKREWRREACGEDRGTKATKQECGEAKHQHGADRASQSDNARWSRGWTVVEAGEWRRSVGW